MAVAVQAGGRLVVCDVNAFAPAEVAVRRLFPPTVIIYGCLPALHSTGMVDSSTFQRLPVGLMLWELFVGLEVISR
jgi:hypothetical protein